MHEFDRQSKIVPFDTFLLAAGESNLQTLGLPDVATASDSTYLASEQRPPQANEMGFGIHDVREALGHPLMYSRDDGIWGFGDTVQATVTFNLYEKSATETLVRAKAEASTEVGNEQTLATFTLTGRSFTPQELATIKRLGLVKCNAQFFVVGLVNGNYDAQIRTISAIQRPFDGNYESLQQLPERAPVMVEGTVVDYRPGRRQQLGIPIEQDSTAPTITVQTGDGAEIVTQLSHGNLFYDGSIDSAKPTPPHPVPGDPIRIAANWRRIGSSQHGSSLATLNRGNAHLLAISKERDEVKKWYGAALEQFSQTLAQTKDPAAARHLYSQFMNTHVGLDEGGQLFSNFNDSGLEHIKKQVENRFADLPPAESPIGLQFYPGIVIRLQRVSKTDIFSLTYREFAQLSHKIAAGEHAINVPADQDAGTVTDIYNFFHNDETTTKTLIMASLRDRYQQISERLMQSKHAYNRHDVAWVRDAIKTCADTPNLRFGAVRLAEFCQVFFANPEHTPFHQEVGQGLLTNIQSILRKCGVWRDQSMRELGPGSDYHPNPLLYLADAETFAGLKQSLEAVLPHIRHVNHQSKRNAYYPYRLDSPGIYGHQIRGIQQLLAELSTKLPPQQ